MTLKRRIEQAEAALAVSTAQIDGIGELVWSGITDDEIGIQKSWNDVGAKPSPNLWKKVGRRIAAIARQRPEIVAVGRALLELLESGKREETDLDDDQWVAIRAAQAEARRAKRNKSRRTKKAPRGIS